MYCMTKLCTVKQNYVLYHKIPYYIIIGFEVMSMCNIGVFIGCQLWTNHISSYKAEVLFTYSIYKIVITVFYSQELICTVALLF